MDMSFLVRGLILGFSIAAPVGPIGILCIRRTLAEGRTVGIVSGLGAATADLVYGILTGFGLTLVSSLLVGQQFWFRLIGGFFLLYLGVTTFLTRPAEKAAQTTSGSGKLAGAYFSTFLLTLSNPMTILSFAAVFAGMGLGATRGSYFDAGLLVLGVFLGSAAWWLLLSSGVSLLRSRVNTAVLTWVNRFAGAVLVVFGFLALVGLVSLG
jgi:threonine/homoserine/homoserine lactone efflux protein